MNSYLIKKGFTLIEIILVIAVLVVLAVMAFTSFSNFGKKYSLISAADKTVSYLEEARSKTLSSENSLRYGVHFEEDLIVLFSESYVAGNQDNNVYNLPDSVRVSDITIGGGSEVLFEKLSGETYTAGTVTISLSDGSQSRIIEIQPTGNIFLIES